MIQYIIKDGRGKALQSRTNFPSYTGVAREMLAIKATLPLTVWAHSTILGAERYDNQRTQRLSTAVREDLKDAQVQS